MKSSPEEVVELAVISVDVVSCSEEIADVGFSDDVDSNFSVHVEHSDDEVAVEATSLVVGVIVEDTTEFVV